MRKSCFICKKPITHQTHYEGPEGFAHVRCMENVKSFYQGLILLPADKEKVFGNPIEFKKHHGENKS